MPEPGIYILTGPVQSGKTTSLQQWCAQRNDVYGILTPVTGGKRFFVDIETQEQFPMEAAGEEIAMAVGRFVFSRKAFDRATAIIRNAIDKKGWLIIDEIGPLELRGEGFSDVLKEVLPKRTGRLILVVRAGLTEQVINYFRTGKAICINTVEGL